jgi:hypothetical protein
LIAALVFDDFESAAQPLDFVSQGLADQRQGGVMQLLIEGLDLG